MDKPGQAIRRTLAAINAPLYDIGILSDRGMFPPMDGLTATEVFRRVLYLQSRNAQGGHIFFRPSGEHRFTVLDDVNRSTIARLVTDGFSPCAVIETSPANFQARLKHAQVFSKALSSFAARTLAERYGADTSAADWRRFGRLPGLTNRKPIHRTPAGGYPLVRLIGSTGHVYGQAEVFAFEISKLHSQREQERNICRQRLHAFTRLIPDLTLGRFRNSIKYINRPAAADMAFAIAAFAHGWSEQGIAAALKDDYLSRDSSECRRNAYISRTLAKAIILAGL